jgi:hypothetical protein
MSAQDTKQDKVELDHHEQQESAPSGGAVGKIAGMVAPSSTTRDGDMGATWLEEYTGDRPELSDEDNKRVRNRIDRHLMPM